MYKAITFLKLVRGTVGYHHPVNGLEEISLFYHAKAGLSSWQKWHLSGNELLYLRCLSHVMTYVTLNYFDILIMCVKT